MTAGASRTETDPPNHRRFRDALRCARLRSGYALPTPRAAQESASDQPCAILTGGPFCAPIGGPVCTPIDTVIRNCDILSYQDTLFPDAGATLFDRCLIAGSYDFIFGGARAWFERCEIRSRLRPADPVEGYIVAPSTPIEQPYGFVFHDCRLTRDAGVPRHSVFLGRPWRPSSAFPDGRYGDPRFVGATTFLDCWMDDHIAPAGWTEMWYTGKDGNPRTMLQPEDARFATFGSRGPGRAEFLRGARLTASQAQGVRMRDVLKSASV